MFRLAVFYGDDLRPRHEESLGESANVLTRIRELLDMHAECARIEVWTSGKKMFAVDRRGNRLP